MHHPFRRFRLRQVSDALGHLDRGTKAYRASSTRTLGGITDTTKSCLARRASNASRPDVPSSVADDRRSVCSAVAQIGGGHVRWSCAPSEPGRRFTPALGTVPHGENSPIGSSSHWTRSSRGREHRAVRPHPAAHHRGVASPRCLATSRSKHVDSLLEHSEPRRSRSPPAATSFTPFSAVPSARMSWMIPADVMHTIAALLDALGLCDPRSGQGRAGCPSPTPPQRPATRPAQVRLARRERFVALLQDRRRHVGAVAPAACARPGSGQRSWLQETKSSDRAYVNSLRGPQ